MKLFVDTWGWLVLRDKHETRHKEVSDFYCNFRRSGGIIYTTDYILDETFTLLFKRLPFSKAKESIQILDKAIEERYLQLKLITAHRFKEAKNLRLKFHDKPSISFTDLTSMVIMKEIGISKVLTEDAHFIKVGMGFQIVP